MTELEEIDPELALELYLDDRRSHQSKATTIAHRSRLSSFVDWLDERGIDNLNELTGRLVKEYKLHRRKESDWASSTEKSNLDTIRVFVRWAEGIEAVEANLSQRVQSPVLNGDENVRHTELDSETAEKAARLQPGGVRRGPALFQEGAEIGPNTYLRVSTVVGLDVHVGHGVEVKNSVLVTDASVGHFSYIGDSVLGRGVNFGAGTNVANLRHDDANVRVTVEGDRVDTGRRKLGAIVGDGAKAGINTPLNAGLKLGAGTTIAPGESVLRDRLSD